VGGCKGKGPSQAPPTTKVLVAEVQQRDVPTYAQWIGTLDGFVNAQIRAQVQGYLLSQDYNEGDFVHRGAALFHIDPRTFNAAVDLAQANLARDAAQAKYADVDAKRVGVLYDKGAATLDEWDKARSATAAAAATVDADVAALNNAKLQLGYCTIVSPVDGVAGLAAAQVGDLVGPTGMALTTVSAIDPIKVLYTPSEQEYLNFRRQFPTPADVDERIKHIILQLILASGDAYPYQGRIYGKQRELDVRTGTIQLVGIFPNPAQLLRPGQFARVRRWDVQKGVLLIPQRAVTDTQGIYQVAVVDGQNKVHIQNVQAGDRVGSWWKITAGLRPGQRVVAEGVQKVRDGQVVDPQPFVAPQDSGIPELPTFTPASMPAILPEARLTSFPTPRPAPEPTTAPAPDTSTMPMPAPASLPPPAPLTRPATTESKE
jgi:membrane fusion protein (multidrug efflux system)